MNINLDNINILEIGCGAGEFLNNLEKVKKGHLIGIDISEEAIKIAMSSSRGAKFMVADGNYLPFKDNTFDIVIVCEVIEHLPYGYTELLKEVDRVLKENGLLIISFPNYINIFYLLVRLIAQFFNLPHLIALQPVDRIYTFFEIFRIKQKIKFHLITSKGKAYFHTKVPLLNKFNKFSRFFDSLKLQFLSFHPVFALRKKRK